MRPKRVYSGYIADISSAIEQAQRFLGDSRFEEFSVDDRTNLATMRLLEIVGEATKRLPSEIRALDPEIPWSDMARMRDRIIHQYDHVDLAVVWETVQRELPPLLPRLQRLQRVVEQQEKEEREP